ncbi:protein of unknown function [Clostridium beijerinckii]|nr:protein of unknown function [Clostridium beijerinckii]
MSLPFALASIVPYKSVLNIYGKLKQLDMTKYYNKMAH